MDRINGLSDELLIKILSFLPTEDAVSTSILSKRWECLWKWLPKLDFTTYGPVSKCKHLGRFLNRNLPLHRAPVIESFCLKSEYSNFKPEDVQLWVVIAVSRYLRELEISYDSDPRQPNILPSSLYICKSLVILKLYGGILLDVPRMACLPSLKILQLERNKYLDRESLRRLLSICPVLEDLSVCLHYDNYPRHPKILPSSLYICKSLVILKLYGGIRLDVPRMVCLPSLKILQLERNKYLVRESLRRLLSICPVLEDLSVCLHYDSYTGMINVVVPSLQRLSLYIPYEGYSIDGLVIDTPSLKYLYLEHRSEHIESYSCVIENMPELEEAYVVFMDRFTDLNSLIGSITSVKRLTIYSEDVYGDGFIFNQLEHLKLCLCTFDQLNLLVRLLEDSPNLQVLDMFDMDHYDSIFLGERYGIDESLMSSLKNFDWSKYLGRPQQKDLEVYILEERLSLEDPNRDHVMRRMIRELSISLRPGS